MERIIVVKNGVNILARGEGKRIVIEVESEGGLSFDTMVVIVRCLSQIFDRPILSPPARVDSEAIWKMLDQKLDEWELSVRAANCAQKHGIVYVGQLVQLKYGDLADKKGIGETTAAEFDALVREKSPGAIRLGMSPEEIAFWVPPLDRLIKSLEPK